MNFHENNSGAIPKNNTEYNKPKVTIKNPLVRYTKVRYLEASSIYGPSITSDFALIYENGYSFNIIIYPIKNTTVPMIPAKVNRNGPLAS